ncbi:uncharacterized protein LOC142577860 [Dermacentor variabilis]|uniref:uncharacterized protein LOC142577860 n=1 Tax=Dermacentor variabilis TaxID=34621 RepID=UPI003F5C2D0C
MHFKVVLAVLAFIGPLTIGAKMMVNLTDEARKYIEGKNSSGLVDEWGLDADTVYKLSNGSNKKKPPVNVTVKKLKCVPEMDGKQVLKHDKNCREKLDFFISRGIQSPFNISTKIKFPLIGRSAHPEVVELDLNNKANIYNRLGQKPGTPNMTTCKFSVEVNFHGFFVYHTTDRKHFVEDNYHFFPVSVLSDPSKHLIRKGGKLAYNITGDVVQTMCL